MGKIFAVVGAIVVALVLVLGGFIGYAAYTGRGLDESSKQYVENNIPPILSTWSENELVKRASPELLKASEKQPGLVDKLFRKLSGLGALTRFGKVEGSSNISYTTENGKVITASYTAQAKFEHGKAQLRIRLIQRAGEWRILGFWVDSPILLE